jgi:hypothetical protein
MSVGELILTNRAVCSPCYLLADPWGSERLIPRSLDDALQQIGGGGSPKAQITGGDPRVDLQDDIASIVQQCIDADVATETGDALNRLCADSSDTLAMILMVHEASTEILKIIADLLIGGPEGIWFTLGIDDESDADGDARVEFLDDVILRHWFACVPSSNIKRTGTPAMLPEILTSLSGRIRDKPSSWSRNLMLLPV